MPSLTEEDDITVWSYETSDGKRWAWACSHTNAVGNGKEYRSPVHAVMSIQEHLRDLEDDVVDYSQDTPRLSQPKPPTPKKKAQPYSKKGKRR